MPFEKIFRSSPTPIIVISHSYDLVQSNTAGAAIKSYWDQDTDGRAELPSFLTKKNLDLGRGEANIDGCHYKIAITSLDDRWVLYFQEKFANTHSPPLLELFAQKTNNAIIITDAKGFTTWVNSSFEKMTGYAHAEIKGVKPGKLLQGSENGADTKAKFKSLLNCQKPFEIEIKNFRKNGEAYWALMSVTPVFDDNGVLENYMALVSDQSEKLEIIHQLKESENRYRVLVETSSSFIYQTDHQGYFTFVNSVGIEKMGYTKEEMIGMNFSELIAPSWKSKVALFYQNQFLSKITESYYEFPAITKVGETIWIGQNVHMNQENGWIKSFQAYASDITEKKILENELEKQKKLLNSILASLPLVVYLKQENGDYIFINNHSDYSKKSEAEQRLDFVKHFDYSDQQVWNSKKPLETVEKVIFKNQQKYYIVGKKIIYPESSNQALLLGYAYDITERKYIEEDLRKAKNRVEKSMAAKEKFISIMSHEIRTPMNAIVGINNLLLQSPHNVEQREYFTATKTASENLLKILNNVLEISKLDAGKIAIASVNMSLVKLVDEVTATFRFKAAEKNLQLLVELDPNIPAIIKGDALKLHQILVNLVSNAMKFTHEGHVLVKVNLVEKIDEKLILKFSVIDTGIGIPQDKLEVIFESFSQANAGIMHEYGGTGLGLTITRSLVELQGGEIELDSVVGRGSTFVFQLPFELSFEELPKEEQKVEYNLEGLRILVVEDNVMNQMVVQKFLEKKKVQLYISNHGKEAIEIILQHSVDLILMDLQMPVMDGYEATKYIRKKLKLSTTSLPIIAMTAAAAWADSEGRASAGFNDILIKPFDPEKMYALIAKYTQAQPMSPAVVQSKKESAKNEAKITNLEYLTISAGDSKDFVVNMINIFLSQTPGYLEEIHTYFETHNWIKLHSVVHKMKPTVAMMGIELRGEIEEIEQLAKVQSNLPKLEALINTLIEQCELAVEELKDTLQEMSEV